MSDHAHPVDPARVRAARARKQGRVVYYRLSEGFPDPLRQHCLRSLVELSRRVEQQK